MAANDSTKSGKRFKHGCCKKGQATPEYVSWHSMKARCYNPNVENYHRYGGRGIAVCHRWRNSFVNFLEDMGTKPFPEATIHRIDNDGNYELDNCKWASSEEQGLYTSTTRRITYNGETMSLKGWARKLGIDDTTLGRRLASGWTIENTLTTPPLPRDMTGGAQLITHDGITLSIRGWSRRVGISAMTLARRLKKGWSTEKALTTPTRLHK